MRNFVTMSVVVFLFCSTASLAVERVGDDQGYTRYADGERYLSNRFWFDVTVPEGVAGCTDGSMPGGHGVTLGPPSKSCPEILSNPPAAVWGFYWNVEDFGGIEDVTGEWCGANPVTKEAKAVSGVVFRRCVDPRQTNRNLVYLALYNPSDGNALSWILTEVRLICDPSDPAACDRWADIAFSRLRLFQKPADWPEDCPPAAAKN
ncbi:MAG: hypothetical protein HQL37_16215 [Alphaproteobacteria bacterium]|nr:hypothetical protein [Alphaproteobacteria bacterium]